MTASIARTNPKRQFGSCDIGHGRHGFHGERRVCSRNREISGIDRATSEVSRLRLQNRLPPCRPCVPCPNSATSKRVSEYFAKRKKPLKQIGLSGFLGNSRDRCPIVLRLLGRSRDRLTASLLLFVARVRGSASRLCALVLRRVVHRPEQSHRTSCNSPGPRRKR